MAWSEAIPIMADNAARYAPYTEISPGVGSITARPLSADVFKLQCNFRRGSVLRPMRSAIISSAVRNGPYSAIWCMR